MSRFRYKALEADYQGAANMYLQGKMAVAEARNKVRAERADTPRSKGRPAGDEAHVTSHERDADHTTYIERHNEDDVDSCHDA